MKPNQEDTKPWYKQFWPWMLIALPASAVIAGIATIIIATTYSHSMVDDDYYKEGLAINRSKERQRQAVQLGLSFEVSITEQSVTLTSNTELSDPVVYLAAQHPITDKLDTTLVLNRIPDTNTYRANDIHLLPVSYRIRIYPPAQNWEMHHRWHPQQESSKTFVAQ